MSSTSGVSCSVSSARLAGGTAQVEKTSYDDYYLDATAACCAPGPLGQGLPEHGQQQLGTGPSSPPACLTFAYAPGSAAAARQQPQDDAGARWAALAPDLQRGAQLAAALRAAVTAELEGVTVSCGVARSKLVARQAGPANKPDGLTGETLEGGKAIDCIWLNNSRWKGGLNVCAQQHQVPRSPAPPVPPACSGRG